MKKLLIAILIVALMMSATACGVGKGAVQGDDCICFDADSIGWESANILLVLSDLDTGDSEEFVGTKGADGLRIFDMSDADIQINHVYTAAFHNADTDEETYPLMLDTACLGDTAYADSAVLENPSDDSKTLYETRWKSSWLGPMLQITSLGNVVGETVPVNTSPYQMLIDFLASGDKDGLTNVLKRNGKSAQSTIDHVASALNLTKEDVIKAIEEAKTFGHSVTGEKADWSKQWDASKFRGPVASDMDKNGRSSWIRMTVL